MTWFSDEYIRNFISEAVEMTKAERDIEGNTDDASSLIERVKKYRSYIGNSKVKRTVIGPGWRVNKRKIGEDRYRVYLFSPDSDDLPPDLYPPKPQEIIPAKKERIRYFPDWAVENLTSYHMQYVTVIPKKDVDRIGSVGMSEQILLYLARQKMDRDDIRVIINKTGKGRETGYTARLLFLGEDVS